MTSAIMKLSHRVFFSFPFFGFRLTRRRRRDACRQIRNERRDILKALDSNKNRTADNSLALGRKIYFMLIFN